MSTRQPPAEPHARVLRRGGCCAPREAALARALGCDHVRFVISRPCGPFAQAAMVRQEDATAARAAPITPIGLQAASPREHDGSAASAVPTLPAASAQSGQPELRESVGPAVRGGLSLQAAPRPFSPPIA